MHGYLLKSSPPEAVERAVHAVAGGDGVYDGAVVDRIARHLSSGAGRPSSSLFPQLTPGSTKRSNSWHGDGGAAVLLGVFSLGLLAFVIGAVAQNGLMLEHWSDYLVVYVGAPIGAAVIVAAVQTARRSARSAGMKTSSAR